MRKRIQRPSPALVISLIALFVAMGGVGYAAVKIDGKNLKNKSVAGKKLKKKTIAGGKVKSNTLGGTQINESKLGKVPSATAADKATAADSATTAVKASNADALGGQAPDAYARSSLGAVHRVGAAGEPAFNADWTNLSATFEPAGFFKDGFGIVHLLGEISRGAAAGSVAFVLPEGFRPARQQRFVVIGDSDTANAVVRVEPGGDVQFFGLPVSNDTSLAGISFRTD